MLPKGVSDRCIHISPARSSAVNFYGEVTVDYERELAQLDERGHRPLRRRGTGDPTMADI